MKFDLIKNWRILIMIFAVLFSLLLIDPFPKSGVQVISVSKDSPFYGTVQVGEYITWANEREISTPDDLYIFEGMFPHLFQARILVFGRKNSEKKLLPPVMAKELVDLSYLGFFNDKPAGQFELELEILALPPFPFASGSGGTRNQYKANSQKKAEFNYIASHLSSPF